MMMLIMYHTSDRWLVRLVLFVYRYRIVIVLVTLLVFHLMMVVLDVSNCPYLHSPVTVVLMIIWSGRCVWIRFFLPTIIVKRRDFNLPQLNSQVMC